MKKEGFFDSVVKKVGESVQSQVNESTLPTEKELGYKSTVGTYGGKLAYTKEGRLIFDMSGVISRIDRAGDAVLRTYDEHTVKDPIKLLRKHPRLFFKFLAPGTKRYRGTPVEIEDRIKALGLDDVYSTYSENEKVKGIEIKEKSIYEEGRPLQDIYRSDLIESDELKAIDRFEALGQASKYIRNIHDNHGAVGEVLPSDIIFRETEEEKVDNPVLNIPDIIYNAEKNTSEIDKKTTDLLDFVASIAIEELRRSNVGEGEELSWDNVSRAIKTILDAYGDDRLTGILKSFVKRGRLTLQGDEKSVGLSDASKSMRPITSMHNKARLDFDKKTTSKLREVIIDGCDKYLKK